MSVLAALGSIGIQFAVVARLWAAFVETVSLQGTLALSAAAAVVGLALAVVAVVVRRGSPGVLAPIGGLLNLGLLAAHAYLFTIL